MSNLFDRIQRFPIGPKVFIGISTLIVLLPLVLPSASLATEILIFAMAVLGCNLLLGYVGLLSFGQGMFFGAGAYCAALAMIHLGFGFIPAVFVGMITGALVAVVAGFFSVRRTGIYFVMLTFAFTQMAYFMSYVLSGWTGGENGLRSVPRPSLTIGEITIFDISSPTGFYWMVGLLFLVVYWIFTRLVRSPFGSTLLAIRENEVRAAALGYNTRLFKLVAFVISGAVTGLAGTLYAMMLNFVPIENISLAMSERILIMTIIGGTGSLVGAILGSTTIVLLAEFLSAVWPRWIMGLGVALIAVVIFMRGGLWGGLESLFNRYYRPTDAQRRKEEDSR